MAILLILESFDEVIVDLDFPEGVEVVSGEFRRWRLETLHSSHRMVFLKKKTKHMKLKDQYKFVKI